MKKIIALLLACLLCVALCACGNKPKDEGNVQSDSTTEMTVVDDENSMIDDEKTIVIDGEKYSLPTAAKNLLDDGWKLPEDAISEKLEAGKAAQYFFPLCKNGESKIKNVSFSNKSTAEATLAECDIISLNLIGNTDDNAYVKCSFTLPNGISEKSTYEDILNVFGTEDQPKEGYSSISDDYDTEDEGTELFEKYGFEFYVYADEGSSNPYNYIFEFNADKTICGVEIESINY